MNQEEQELKAKLSSALYSAVQDKMMNLILEESDIELLYKITADKLDTLTAEQLVDYWHTLKEV